MTAKKSPSRRMPGLQKPPPPPAPSGPQRGEGRTRGGGRTPVGPLGPQGQKPTRDVPRGYAPNWKGDAWKKESPYRPLNPKEDSKRKPEPKPMIPKKKTGK